MPRHSKFLVSPFQRAHLSVWRHLVMLPQCPQCWDLLLPVMIPSRKKLNESPGISIGSFAFTGYDFFGTGSCSSYSKCSQSFPNFLSLWVPSSSYFPQNHGPHPAWILGSRTAFFHLTDIIVLDANLLLKYGSADARVANCKESI